MNQKSVMDLKFRLQLKHLRVEASLTKKEDTTGFFLITIYTLHDMVLTCMPCSLQHTKRTEFELFTRCTEMNDRLVDNCQRVHDRNQEKLRECLTNTTNACRSGLEDLSEAVALVKNHRENLNRMFSINRQADLKICQVINCCL